MIRKAIQEAKKIKVYHVGNPMFRKDILKNGLEPRVGDSYGTHFQDKQDMFMGPVVFFSLDKNNLFDSTFDDDVWEINIPKDLLNYKEDPSMKFPMAYTKNKIDPKYLKLIHKGTGKSSW